MIRLPRAPAALIGPTIAFEAAGGIVGASAGRIRRTERGRIAIILVHSLAIRPTASPGRQPRANVLERRSALLARPGSLGAARGELASFGAGDWLRSAPGDWLLRVPQAARPPQRVSAVAHGRASRRWRPARSASGHSRTKERPSCTPGFVRRGIGFARRRGLGSFGAGDWLRSAPGIGFARRRGVGVPGGRPRDPRCLARPRGVPDRVKTGFGPTEI